MFFSSMKGSGLMMIDALTASQLGEFEINPKEKITLYDVGVGNAFMMKNNGVLDLYTAGHCADNIDRFIKKINEDIAIIDYKKKGTEYSKAGNIESSGYNLGKFTDNDSVFVRGFLVNKKGKVSNVEISGIGHVRKQSDYKNASFSGGQTAYPFENTIDMVLKENVDLSSLSGAPVFNKAGLVVGVYSGRTIEVVIDTKDTSYHIRISPFK